MCLQKHMYVHIQLYIPITHKLHRKNNINLMMSEVLFCSLDLFRHQTHFVFSVLHCYYVAGDVLSFSCPILPAKYDKSFFSRFPFYFKLWRKHVYLLNFSNPILYIFVVGKRCIYYSYLHHFIHHPFLIYLTL